MGVISTAGIGASFRLLAAASTVAAGSWWALAGVGRSSSLVSVETTIVQRMPLETRLVVGGDLLSVKETALKCEVEDVADVGGVAVVSLIENGARVKKGDELCRLDSSAHEEKARKAEIAVNEAQAARDQALAALEVAKVALIQYEQGETRTETSDYERRIALGKSDLALLAKRLDWTEEMVAKGYTSSGQLLSERQELEKAKHELTKAEGEYKLFREFKAPKEIVSLRSKVASAEHAYRLEEEKLAIQKQRLEHLRRQVANCVIRAPQDGVAVHDWRSKWFPIRPGALVYEGQDLLKIPDLSRMEVEVAIHETVGARVKAGMPAVVSIDAIPGRTFSARVASILPMPVADWKAWDERMRQYIARVRMDDTPPGLLPLMSARVEIDTGKLPDALAIPVHAMSHIAEESACYVASPQGLSRRAIKTGRSTPDYIEIVSGLEEGEQVAVDFAEAEAVANRSTKR
ncbi:efflux RND transporter periplasmic adaptor subunit [Paludisphaera rhizosphaerae]|uniref:efflux RND transporter periplasmic adaptor subunit n=1 Tax=Paludisphaera rhizosphaerae TaxID=2711216 RepID=UPI0013ED7D1B|nr:efflux RND transporter periplasmic adaptor subunit [Paludisphaera rhizosphaerae]